MSGLRQKTTRALGWDLFGSYTGQIISLVISIFLARMLEPAEFGLVGMSMVFINVLSIFADFGFASALIQNKDNNSLTYSSVFYINVLAGLVLTGLVMLAAPLVGAFYKNDQVTLLVRVFSVTFLLNAFNIVQRTILRKDLNFRVLTIRGIVSQTIAGIIAVILAFRGFGVYALVIQNILAAVINTVILWRVADWYPKLEFSMSEVKKLFSFSAYVFAAHSARQVLSQIDVMAVGKLFSPATLGFYSRANSVNSLINKNSVNSISKVFFPVLSSINDDEERFKQVYLKVVNIVAGISVFLTGVFFLCGEELIIVAFGEKWEPSVFIFKILILKGFTYPVSRIVVNAFLAKGKSRENFHYGNIRKTLSLTPLIFAYFYGFEAFLYALVGMSILGWLLNNIFVSVSLKVPILTQAAAVLPYLILGTLIVAGISLVIPQDRSLVFAAVRVIMFVLLFGAGCYLFRLRLFEEFVLHRDKLWEKLKGILRLV